jgi:hypothetical protein
MKTNLIQSLRELDKRTNFKQFILVIVIVYISIAFEQLFEQSFEQLLPTVIVVYSSIIIPGGECSVPSPGSIVVTSFRAILLVIELSLAPVSLTGGAYTFIGCCCNVAHSSRLFSPTCISFISE